MYYGECPHITSIALEVSYLHSIEYTTFIKMELL